MRKTIRTSAVVDQCWRASRCAASRHPDRSLHVPVHLGVARRAHKKIGQGGRLLCCACSRSKRRCSKRRASRHRTWVILADEIPLEPDTLGARRIARSGGRKAWFGHRGAAGQPPLGDRSDRADVFRRDGNDAAPGSPVCALRDACGHARHYVRCCARWSIRTSVSR